MRDLNLGKRNHLARIKVTEMEKGRVGLKSKYFETPVPGFLTTML